MEKRSLVNNVKLFTIFLISILMLLVCTFAYGKTEPNIAYAQENSSIFGFAQTSATECSVRLIDKTVEKAIIPSKTVINGSEYTVTSIAGNGFSNATNLKKVRLQQTIKTIGNTAFANCNSLSSITMPSVESIGTNAFNLCTSLNYLILPNSISIVAPTILRNCNTQVYVRNSESGIQELGWATNWNGLNANQTVEYSSDFTPEVEYEPIIGESEISTFSMGTMNTDSIVGYYVSDFQPFIEQGRDDVFVYIPNTYEGKPVLGIMETAFMYNTIDNLVIGYANSPIHIESYAFNGLECDSITINRDVDLVVTDWQGNLVLAEYLFAASTVSTVILPNTITGFGDGTFDGCTSLTDIQFITPKSMTKIEEEAIASDFVSTGIVNLPSTEEFETIGTGAFAATFNITELYIPSNVTTVGSSILASWGCVAGHCQRVIIDYEQFAALPEWNEDTQQGWHSTWKSGCNESIIEYSGIFEIVYHLNGGTHVGTPITSYSSQVSVDLGVAIREGYTFGGWYDNALLSGESINNIPKGSSGDKVFYADWEKNQYTIIYDSNIPSTASSDIEGVTLDSEHYYDEGSTLRNNSYILLGWNFIGWNTESDGSGTSYVNGDNIINLSTGSPVTLYAQWEEISYTVLYHNNKPSSASGQLTGEMLNSMHFYDIESALSDNQFSLVGWSFAGWNTAANGSGTSYADGASISTLSTTIIPLYAQWSANNFVISYAKNRPSNATNDVLGTMANSDHTYDTESSLRINTFSLVGWTFAGWNTAANGSGTSYADGASAKILATSDITLFAKWTPNTYKVTFNNQSGTGGTDNIQAIYDSPMPTAIAPTMTGKTFQGYFTGINGAGTKYYNANMSSANNWNIANATTLYAYWIGNPYVVTLNKQGGTGGTDNVQAIYGSPMPPAIAPTRQGYTFHGYFTGTNGEGTKYYNAIINSTDMSSARNWDIANVTTLYAYWIGNPYVVTLNKQGGTGGTDNVQAIYGSPMPPAIAPTRQGYTFHGYFTGTNGTGTKYYNANMSSARNWDIANATTLYAYFEVQCYGASISTYHISDWQSNENSSKSFKVPFNETITFASEKSFNYFGMNPDPPYNQIPLSQYGVFSAAHVKYENGDTVPQSYYSKNENTLTLYANCFRQGEQLKISVEYKNNCIAEGSLITLADGSQKAVELLTGNELLLVWNLKTGTFDTAPILFIDSDPLMSYEVINLTFSDGTTVKVISEHAFWNIDLNKYVYLRNDASQYIGDRFNKQTTDINGNMIWTAVQLTSVVVANEVTTAWSPVTYGYLCYYVNGMLTMPGGITGFINIFEVDAETMQYDQEAMQADIEEYGLFTYEEFAEILPVPQVIFDAFDAQYLKVAIGKGMITIEEIAILIDSYSEFFNIE